MEAEKTYTVDLEITVTPVEGLAAAERTQVTATLPAQSAAAVSDLLNTVAAKIAAAVAPNPAE